MKALVTGGGGFLGGSIVRMLLARGDSVRVLARNAYGQLQRQGVDCRQGDLRDYNAVVAACADVDVVYHVAAKAGVWGDASEFFGINVKGTANVIEACRQQAVPRLVYTSSPSVVFGRDSISNGDETLAYPPRYLATYPQSKAMAERMVLQANGSGLNPEKAGGAQVLATCSLRPHLIWGPGDPHLVPRLITAAAAGKLAQVGSGQNLVDISYVDNAAHAHVLAAQQLRADSPLAGQAYFIGDAEPVQLWQWLNALLCEVGVPPVRRRLPLPLAYGIGAVAELVHHLLPRLGEPRMTRFVALQLAHSHYFSHAKAQAHFAYTPIVSNDEGVRRVVQWWQQEQAACT